MLGPLFTNSSLLWVNLYELTPLTACMLLGGGINAAVKRAK